MPFIPCQIFRSRMMPAPTPVPRVSMHMESPGISLPTPLFHSASAAALASHSTITGECRFRLHCIFKQEAVEAGKVGRPVKSTRRQLQRPGSPYPYAE